MQEKIENKS